jgi:hypothetical protein
MNKFDIIKNVCKSVRIIVGIALISVAIFTGMNWFYLGAIPLIAGLIDFCPTCIATKKCTV